MKLLGVVAVAALALLPLSVGATPITEPIVFDFEDGLQGWELSGSAQRVQTQLLGGEWAIFGDGNLAATEMLAPFAVPFGTRVSFNSLVVDGDEVFLIGGRSNGDIFWRLDWGGPGFLFSAPPVVAFIDNITFHPVPEPSALVLLAIAGIGLRRSRSAVGGAIRAGVERLHRQGRGEK